ncbi:RtcB family protein [Candidatus Pacearchaeota archaeon]|nr:RtcB family protein [Candidatus Pacearchaeota archaeon]
MSIKKKSDNIFEIEKEGKMNVPGIVFASQDLFDKIKQDKTLEQVKNVACLPGIVEKSIAMPDAHQGYGFSVGGVAAFDLKKGIISPGGIGYDINCGVRLLRTNLKKKDFLEKREKVLHDLSRAVPSGVGRGTKTKLSDKEMKEVLEKGSEWALEKGFAMKDDLEHTEDGGKIIGADASMISMKAIGRGRNQLGSIGAGNHFLEIQEVEEIFDENVAKVFGLSLGEIVILIHTGSRGLGHQTASDYILKMEREYGTDNLPDRELACAPIYSQLGKDYRAAMACAANFAFVNRQIITHEIRESMKRFFPKVKVKTVYDIAHNIAKFEEFVISGKKVTLCVHRKGATRSFGPGRKEICEDYRKVGQPIFIPGSMGTYSYVLVGTERAREISFASTAHGAGRVMSRTAAKRELTVEGVKKNLEKYGVTIKAGSSKGIVEEAPEAYKDVNEVVRVSDELGIGKMVARLKPLAVLKG